MTEPAHELNTMWGIIHNGRPDIREQIPKSQRPPDGMPHATTDQHKPPLNLGPLSTLLQIDQAAFEWAAPQCTTINQALTWLTNNAHKRAADLDPDTLEEFETDTRTLYNLTLRHVPALHLTTREGKARIWDKDLHYPTIKELAEAMRKLGHPKPLGTLRRWVTENRLNKTGRGYSLNQALEHTIDTPEPG